MGQKSWRVFCYVVHDDVCENRLVGIVVYQPESAKLLQMGLLIVCKNLVKKFIYINFLMMSLQTKNSIFLVCNEIIKHLN